MRLSWSAMTRTFLFWFSNEHSNFRTNELESLFKLFRLDGEILKGRRVNGPYILMDFPSEEGPRLLMSRSVLAHSCYELWGEGASKEELDARVKNGSVSSDLIQPHGKESFSLRVETYGKTISHSEKVGWIDTFGYLPMEGKVDLKRPTCRLALLMYYGLDPNRAPDLPYYWYFGRWICDGQRKLVSQMNLKERKFIGNTSMDPLLSLLMVNLAGVREHDFVLDPFVGTGSILVAAAAMGAQVMGSDIDYLMLHAKTRSTRAFQGKRTEGESVRANLMQYGLERNYVDVVVGDASRPLWRSDFKFDAIVTDPPYGIRESTERLGSSKAQEPGYKIKEEHLAKHIPAKKDYTLTEIFCDLMDYAMERLVVGGRLVYWIPISRTDYDEDKLPKNPCLKLLWNTEQVLTSFASRRVLVFEKFRECSEAEQRTEMDESALMYRFRYFEVDRENRRSRKSEAFSNYGKATKRGQLLPPEEVAVTPPY